MVQWIDASRAMLGELSVVTRKLHQNSQGLVRLDRHVASVVAAKGLHNPMFATKFNTYIEHCHSMNESPKGRVLLAMIAQRFRLDRARHRTISVLQLQKVELQ